MSTLNVSPIQWSDLQDIDSVAPLNDGDAACLVEVREVLKRYGKRERFGVALLHSHFNLADDEILLESTDVEARTLTTKPVRTSEARGNNIGTVWMLQDGDVTTMAWCRQYCEQGLVGLIHNKAHNREK